MGNISRTADPIFKLNFKMRRIKFRIANIRLDFRYLLYFFLQNAKKKKNNNKVRTNRKICNTDETKPMPNSDSATKVWLIWIG